MNNSTNTVLLLALLALGVYYINNRPQGVTVIRSPGWGWGGGWGGRRGWGGRWGRHRRGGRGRRGI